jgi:nucleolar protein 58
MIFIQIIEISDYRAQLYDYLKNRMTAIAPNLTILVGELVGARLIAHSGMLLCYILKLSVPVWVVPM